jgi:hypothetical protein
MPEPHLYLENDLLEHAEAVNEIIRLESQRDTLLEAYGSERAHQMPEFYVLLGKISVVNGILESHGGRQLSGEIDAVLQEEADKTFPPTE